MLSLTMRIVSAIVGLSLVSLAQFQPAASESADDLNGQNCTILQLLNVQPFPDPDGGFSGGLSLIPAALLAAKEINNRSDILPGFELEVVNIESEGCSRATIYTKGLIKFYRELVGRYRHPSECIVGVMGFPCSSATNILAPITGHKNIDLVTLANSGTPEHRNIMQYPNLFHTISSTRVHSKVLVSLMQKFNWRRIGVVYDSVNIFFRTTANDFVQRVNNLPDAEITASVPIIPTSAVALREAFNIINTEEARITYWQGNDEQNALCLCEAYRRQFLYPGYVYILRYNPSIVKNILATETECSRDEMICAMEGVLMLDYRLEVNNDTVLFSGWNYSEFRQRYAHELDEYAKRINTSLEAIIYGNSFYDQVWAFALALNNSLLSIRSENLSFSDYIIGNPGPISSIIKRELTNLSFQGASGRIEFDENHETFSSVYILQIQNGIAKQIAIYNPFTRNATFNENFRDDIPSDTFDTVYSLLPLWLGVCILVLQGLLFCAITTNVILLLWWRKEREVKATSLLLSVLLSVGCYLLCAGPIIRIIYRVIVIQNTTLHTFLCGLSLWTTTLGLDLVISALLFRLFRVVHVFRSFQKKSKFLSDEYLVLYSVLACAVKAVFLTIWSIVDLYHSHTDSTYVPRANPPQYRAVISCTCDQLGIWLAISYLYTYILLLLVLFLAIQTRRIKKIFFKDTKKVNVFVFTVIITLSTTITLWLLLSEVGIEIGADISEWIGVFIVATMCQACLIIPKLLPVAVKKDMTRRGHKLSRDYTVASEFEWIRRKSRHSISKLIT